MQTISILGREKQLCLAELSSKFGQVEPIADDVAVLASGSKPDINQLGGSIKLGEIISRTDRSAAPKDLAPLLSDLVIKHLAAKGKITFAISAYGQNKPANHLLQKLGINTKKLLRQGGRSVRYVAAKDGVALSAAQLKYNQLTTTGCELIVVWSKAELIVAKTYGYQDIDSYSERDFGRPVRDSKVGMLPPKLAQIMINLAQPAAGQTIFDPFCGNGVVLQEAMLLGHDVVGSDNSPEMVDASQKNLEWFESVYSTDKTFKLELQDATEISSLPANSVIVTEGYLGTPLHHALSTSQEQALINPVNALYSDFLIKTRTLLKPGQKLVISFPVWQRYSGQVHLPVIDRLGQIGYTTHQYNGLKTMIYKREDQFVGREIAVLITK